MNLQAIAIAFALSLAAAGYGSGLAHAGDQIDEPKGYRNNHYDAPVPASLEGATTVSGVDVLALQQNTAAIVIDVIPETRKPADLPDDQLWFPVAHRGIANALWLPDVGFGVLHKTTKRYFMDHLQTATESNKERAVVFYCRTNCWMSWNAAKRAISLGYQDVYWYRDGIEDWLFEGFATENLRPAPGARHDPADVK